MNYWYIYLELCPCFSFNFGRKEIIISPQLCCHVKHKTLLKTLKRYLLVV